MIVLTGATGTVGSQVAEQLTKSGQKFRVVARSPEKAKKDPHVEVVKASYDDRAALDAAFKGATKVFLLTSSTPESVDWHRNIIDAAKKTGAKHIVRLSVPNPDKSSPVKISQWHAASDEYLKASGMQWTVLQPMWFVTNYLGSASTIKKDGALYGCAKDGKIAAIDPRDIAAVAVKTLTTDGHAGKSYVLNGKEPLSHREVAERIAKHAGKTVKYVDLPPDQFTAGLTSAGVPEWYAKDLAAMHQYVATGGMATVDPTLGNLIGKVRTFDDFLQMYGSAFR